MQMSKVYSLYWSIRGFTQGSNPERSTGVRPRLERWLRLTKCVLWYTRAFHTPEQQGRLWAMASSFLVCLGRCWALGGTPQALSWIKKVRETVLFVLQHPGNSRKTCQARRRLRRIFGKPAVVA